MQITPSTDFSEDALADVSSVIAAVDLGSNSFHMVVAEDQHGQLKVIDRIREMVRLGAGFLENGELSIESQEKAIECLQRFGQRIQEIRADSVRAVGTNTFRRAKNNTEFIHRAEKALGHPIQVISGIEEARLIYQGTIHSITGPDGKWLVVDIGGGSTELIIGEKGKPELMESIHMGCVSISQGYFSSGNLEKKKFKKALVAAKLHLQPIVSGIRKLGWQYVVGTAGTIRTVAELMRELELSDRGISYEGINMLIAKLQDLESINNLNYNAIAKERRPVFPGGLVVLKAIFEELEIERMTASEGGLREGLLFDLAGRIHHRDTRDRTVYALMRRYQVDFKHSARIKTAALHLLDNLSKIWDIDNDLAYQFLIWSADLHEVGLSISHSRFHYHGAYLLNNSDLLGFSWNEQRLLACLVGNHRRKLNLDLIEKLPMQWKRQAKYMIIILRLAILMHRDRVAKKIPSIEFLEEDGTTKIIFNKEWLSKHPLTEADLEQESVYLKSIDLNISIMGVS